MTRNFAGFLFGSGGGEDDSFVGHIESGGGVAGHEENVAGCVVSAIREIPEGV
jgi:hypothetical protein